MWLLCRCVLKCGCSGWNPSTTVKTLLTVEAILTFSQTRRHKITYKSKTFIVVIRSNALIQSLDRVKWERVITHKSYSTLLDWCVHYLTLHHLKGLIALQPSFLTTVPLPAPIYQCFCLSRLCRVFPDCRWLHKYFYAIPPQPIPTSYCVKHVPTSDSARCEILDVHACISCSCRNPFPLRLLVHISVMF